MKIAQTARDWFGFLQKRIFVKDRKGEEFDVTNKGRNNKG
jgi:hypothetical protein